LAKIHLNFGKHSVSEGVNIRRRPSAVTGMDDRGGNQRIHFQDSEIKETGITDVRTTATDFPAALHDSEVDKRITTQDLEEKALATADADLNQKRKQVRVIL